MFEYYGLVAGREGHHSFSFEIGHTPAIRRLFEQLWRPLGVCLAFVHSWCDKRVIVDLPNLFHNVAPKRPDIIRLTPAKTHSTPAYPPTTSPHLHLLSSIPLLQPTISPYP